MNLLIFSILKVAILFQVAPDMLVMENGKFGDMLTRFQEKKSVQLIN